MRIRTRRDVDAQSLPEPAEPRRLAAPTRIVVAVYAALLLGAPWIVRYWPGPDIPEFAPPALAAATVPPPCAPHAAETCPSTVDDLD